MFCAHATRICLIHVRLCDFFFPPERRKLPISFRHEDHRRPIVGRIKPTPEPFQVRALKPRYNQVSSAGRPDQRSDQWNRMQ